MNDKLTDLYQKAMERTVTIGGPGGSPAVKLKLLHAAAAAAVGVLLAPRATAAASIVALVKGVTITMDAPKADLA